MHALGYVSAISEKDLKKIDRAAYAGTSLIGKLGVESAFEPRAARHERLPRDSRQCAGPLGATQGALVRDLRTQAPDCRART